MWFQELFLTRSHCGVRFHLVGQDTPVKVTRSHRRVRADLVGQDAPVSLVSEAVKRRQARYKLP
jgi:ATP-dependent Clp protease ATP-binding subunit ClpA